MFAACRFRNLHLRHDFLYDILYQTLVYKHAFTSIPVPHLSAQYHDMAEYFRPLSACVRKSSGHWRGQMLF